jgi:hypothetical protein
MVLFTLSCTHLNNGNKNIVHGKVKSRLNYCLPVYSLKTSIKLCKTIICLVLYGCETLSLTLRKEYRLRVLRRMFGPKREKTTQ